MPRKLAEISKLMKLAEENRLRQSPHYSLKRVFLFSQNHADTYAEHFPDAIKAGFTPTKSFLAREEKYGFCKHRKYTHTALIPVNTSIAQLKEAYNIPDAELLWSGSPEAVVTFGQNKIANTDLTTDYVKDLKP
jgi:hypothetical protein